MRRLDVPGLGELFAGTLGFGRAESSVVTDVSGVVPVGVAFGASASPELASSSPPAVW